MRPLILLLILSCSRQSTLAEQIRADYPHADTSCTLADASYEQCTSDSLAFYKACEGRSLLGYGYLRYQTCTEAGGVVWWPEFGGTNRTPDNAVCSIGVTRAEGDEQVTCELYDRRDEGETTPCNATSQCGNTWSVTGSQYLDIREAFPEAAIRSESQIFP